MPHTALSRRQYSSMFRLGPVPTIESRALTRGVIAATHLRCDGPGLGRTAPYAPEATFMVSLQLRDLPSHPLYRNGQPVPIDAYPENTLTVHDLRDEWQADLRDPFEVFHCHIPISSLESLTDEYGTRRIDHLACSPQCGKSDRIMRNLVDALLPVIDGVRPATQLYSDHLLLTMREHVAMSYGGLTPNPGLLTGKLAPWQTRRATDFMLAHLGEDVSLDQIARECRLSVSYFIRAFKRTTGQTPYRWLMERRIETAERLLGTSMTLSEIALECGFSDQSHLSRVFSQHFGMGPGQWRRNKR